MVLVPGTGISSPRGEQRTQEGARTKHPTQTLALQVTSGCLTRHLEAPNDTLPMLVLGT